MAAEVGSLSKAADQSNLALAAVSRRIAMLEAQYSVSLFVRTGKGVALTPAGAALLTRAREILQLVSLTKSDLTDFARGFRGVVRLMASTSAITQHLPADLATFAKVHPDLRIELREAYTRDIVIAVREGMADIGIAIAGENLDGLTIAPYRSDRLVVVAPRDFEPGLDRVRLLDLADHDFVVMEDNAATSSLLAKVTTRAGVTLRLRNKVASFDAVCRMVQAGFGLGVQPRMVARSFESAMGLRLIELEDDWAARQTLVCTNARGELGSSARLLVQHLAGCATLAAE